MSSLHLSSLHGNIQNPDTLFYKNETIRMLNRALADGNIETAVSDEMLSAVLLLTHIVVSIFFTTTSETLVPTLRTT